MYPGLVPELEVTQNDTSGILIRVLGDDGQPVNLTGYTCTFSAADVNAWTGEDYNPHDWPGYTAAVLRTAADYNKVNGASLALTAATTGDVTWTPTAAHTDTAGEYYWQIKYVLAGVVNRYPRDPTTSRLYIHPALA